MTQIASSVNGETFCQVLPGTKETAVLLVVTVLLSLGLPSTAASQAQTEPTADSVALKEALRKHRFSVRFSDGALSGEGGQMLIDRSAEATVTVLGEMHGTEEIPRMMGALLTTLQVRGEMHHLALETSPWTTARMVDSLQKGRESYDRLVETYPEAIPFYNLRPERTLLARFVGRSGNAKPLWGLDQIFAFSGPLAMDRLETLAASTQARRSVEQVRAAGSTKVAEDSRLQNLPPSVPTPIVVYPPATFDTLRSRFEESEEAQTILRELSTSTRIYRLNDTDNYQSNQIRARYLRENLRRSAREAADTSERPAQIAIKVGARHAYRGITPNNALDVGNLAVELSEERGEHAFNVAFLCGPGSQARAFPNRRVECWPDRLGDTFRALTGEMSNEGDAILFDLEALRPLLHDGLLDPSAPLKKLIWGLDAVVLVPQAQAAERIVPLGPQ